MFKSLKATFSHGQVRRGSVTEASRVSPYPNPAGDVIHLPNMRPRMVQAPYISNHMTPKLQHHTFSPRSTRLPAV